MASPQLQNGYTRIANEIMEALCKMNLSPYESRVLWFLFRKTYGYQRKADHIPSSQFSAGTGLDRRLVHRALKGLSSKKMTVIGRDDKNQPTTGFQKDYAKWAFPTRKKAHVISLDDKGVIVLDDKVSSVEMTKLPPPKERKKGKKEDGYEFLRNSPPASAPQHGPRSDGGNSGTPHGTPSGGVSNSGPSNGAGTASRGTSNGATSNATGTSNGAGIAESTPEGSFPPFWKAYPIKVGKGTALRAWRKLKPNRELQAKILAAIEAQTRWREECAGDPGLFTPAWKHPTTWLNAMAWEDQVEDVGERSKPKTLFYCNRCGTSHPDGEHTK